MDYIHNEKKEERIKALQALQRAKELEAEKIKKGYEYEKYGKIMRLQKKYTTVRKEYLKNKSLNGYYKCQGCGKLVKNIDVHHIIKRSHSSYFYSDPRNFVLLCRECHIKCEDTIEQQKQLNNYYEMLEVKETLTEEYNNLPYYLK